LLSGLVIQHGFIVAQKYLKKDLTSSNLCNTLITVKGRDMVNVMSGEKKIALIRALAEGSGIRQIGRDGHAS
jgi:hypothetical protein